MAVIGVFIILLLLMRMLVMKKTEDLSNALNEIKAIEKRNSALLYCIPDILFVQRRDGVFIDYYTNDTQGLFVDDSMIIGHSMFEMPFDKHLLETAKEKIAKSSG
jgi:hypothetical protein